MLGMHVAMRGLGCMSLLVAFLAAGCAQKMQRLRDPTSAAVVAENAARKSIGLREIKPTWICFRAHGGLEEWMRSETGAARDKAVKRGGDERIEWEEDCYRSGHVASIDDQSVEEELAVHYDYGTRIVELYYIGDDLAARALADSAKGKSATEALAIADAMLAKWSVSRL